MVSISHTQKYSKGRYLTHSKVVIKAPKNYVVAIKKIISSPLKHNNKYCLAKSAILETTEGSVKIINKPSHQIPLGFIIN